MASVREFTNGKLDKNGESPVMLTILAGKAPNRNVLSGTIAKREGLEVGKTYMLQVTEGKASEEFGRQFVFTKVNEVSVMDILNGLTALGPAAIFSIDQADAPDATTVPETIKEGIPAFEDEIVVTEKVEGIVESPAS